MMPGIIAQLGPESIESLKRSLAQGYGGGAGGAGDDGEDGAPSRSASTPSASHFLPTVPEVDTFE